MNQKGIANIQGSLLHYTKNNDFVSSQKLDYVMHQDKQFVIRKQRESKKRYERICVRKIMLCKHLCAAGVKRQTQNIVFDRIP